MRSLLAWMMMALVAGCGAPNPALNLDQIEPPLVTASLEPPSVSPGESQALHVELDIAPSQYMLLVLTLTYPSGHTEQVLKTAIGRDATLAWAVPDDVGRGTVHFRLRTQDCGCGPRESSTVAQYGLEGEATGTFSLR